ncbi:MAG TPA: hypothetical protein VEQ41_05870 [Solirubrobacterales bacterium]|nr:hypothetical protein [Solirubrobacterales bacterium]
MSMFVAWVVYPLVLLALCAGVGLLVDVVCGRRLPGALIAPTGFAAIVVVAQFTSLGDSTADLTVPLVAVLAAAGAGLALPWRFGRPATAPAVAALAVFAVFGAPVILSGEPTFAGYIKLDDTATWLALTDQAMERGRDLEGLEISTYRATLEANLPGGYPVGVFLPFGTAAELIGTEPAWAFQPYLSFLAAMLALCLWRILGEAVSGPRLRAFAVFLAAQPALLFGYAMWGGIKELGAAALVALGAALAPRLIGATEVGHTGGGSTSVASHVRAVVPFALAAGALVGLLSVGGLVWFGPMLLAGALLSLRAAGGRATGLRAGTLAAATLVFSLPVLIAGGFNPFQSGLTAESEIGNLIGPLDPLQALGIWPAGDFRVAPDGTVATAVLIALGLLAAGLGLWAAWRHRAVPLLLFSSALLAALAIVLVGSPWVDGKALATVAPVALSLAVAGAVAALRLDRPTGVALLAVVAGGVLWSNVVAFGSVDLAPRDQLEELERIGDEFAGQGPALMTEYNPYGARYFLRELDAEGASELRVRPVYLRDGSTAEKGEAVDVEEIAEDSLYEYRTLVLRRSPVRSRPPSVYELLWSGDYYEVWQRPLAPSGLPPERLPLGDGELRPAAVPKCSEVHGLGLVLLNNGARGVRMLAARHAPVYDATSGNLRVASDGPYEAWLMGSVRGAVDLYVDEERVGGARHSLQNHGGFVSLGEVELSAGSHGVRLDFGGADLHPGSGGFPRPEAGPLLFTPATDGPGELISVPVEDADRLCGKEWDWIEAVEAG